MYSKVPTNVNFVEREREVLRFWQERDVFKRSIEGREGGENYTFYDGPPTANGKPHIGHVLTRVIKDMIPRYRAMKGCHILRKAGWDTHGLPVELEVEKKLGLDGKGEIEKYGIAPFIDECKESVWKYKGMWEEFSGIVGFWADMDDPYVTYHDDYIESEWWALKQIFDRGLLYKGFKCVPYCPRCGTPLSSHEVAQGYKTVKERSAVVRFRAAGEDAYFLAWTTTPWTLPSNTALCVNPEDTYCRVKAADGCVYYMAKPLLDSVLGSLAKDGAPAYEILEEMKGEALVGRAYEPLYACAADTAKAQGKRAHFVVSDGYVSMSDGTGIVHIAPAFGDDDSRVGRTYDLPFIQKVDARGNMTPDAPAAGMFVKDADPVILSDLDARGLLFAAPKFEHEYPFCWRCNTPLIYYAQDTWFIKMSEVREDLIRNNKTVNWIPESIGEGRFGDWLKNVQDWGLSRNRYWGTPLNIWTCECGEKCSIGSREELRRLAKNCPEKIELHRPFIDEVLIPCPKCGRDMHRTSEVIDCWFDSGAMPFAQWHYPFENQDIFEQNFPADFISEAIDQTRGWFYSLMAISTLIFNKAPYKNVIVLGHVLDKDGQKMSKSKGNAADPMEELSKYGADAIRWYFYSNSAPWLPNKYHEGAVLEGRNKFMGTLWNTYAFFVLYANIDGFDATKYTLDPASLTVMDKWILSRLYSTVGEVDRRLEGYEIPETARALQELVNDLSNWYVRRSRERFWAKGMEADKVAAYMTLHTCLVTIAKIAAPMLPFLAEDIYRNLVATQDATAPESVHLCDFPEVLTSFVDKDLEKAMDEVLEIVTLGRAARASASVKNRQPLATMFVKAETGLDETYLEIIRDELNVKEVRFTDTVRDFTTYTFRPQLRTVGPKYGKQLGFIRTALAELDGNAAHDELEANGAIVMVAPDGTAVSLAEEDLLIEMVKQEGFESAADHGVTVVLDVRLTPELVEEGYVREMISKIQTMRKESGFEVTDHIVLGVTASDRILAILKKNADEIGAATLSDEVLPAAEEGGREWKLGDESVTISVRRI